MGGAPDAPFGNVSQIDPTPEWYKPMQQQLGMQGGGQALNFLNTFASQANPFFQMAKNVQSPLQQQGTSQMGALMGYNPEAQALNQSAPALQNLTNAPAMEVRSLQNPFSKQPQAQMPGVASDPYQGYNPNAAFQGAQQTARAPLQGAPTQAMQNPYADLGFMNQAQGILGAYQPIWEHNLQAQHANLANSAASPYSTAYAQQGAGLDQNALNDYNMFAQQTMMQGLQNQSANQQANQNFMLGAGQQQGQNIAQNNQAQLGQGGLMGQLAGQESQAQLGTMGGMSQFNLGRQGQMNDFTLGAQNLGQQRENNAANFMLQNQNQYQTGNLAARGLQQQGALGALQQYGTLSSQAGTLPFQRAQQGAETGANILQNQFINPTQTMLANSMSYSSPTGMQAMANPQGPSTLQNVAGGVIAAAALLDALKGPKGYGKGG